MNNLLEDLDKEELKVLVRSIKNSIAKLPMENEDMPILFTLDSELRRRILELDIVVKRSFKNEKWNN